MSHKLSKSSGFTLIEVIVSILILSSAMLVLLGLQGASLQKALRDRKQQQAMMIARSILAFVENDPTSFQVQNTTKSAYEMLRALGMKSRDERGERERLAEFETNLRVERIEIPFPATLDTPIAMNQIMLTVYWGESAADELRVVFFVPEE